MTTFFCYPKCSTCQKAKKWLDENDFEYVVRDIKLEPPTREEIKDFHQKSGLPIKKLFNTSGLSYRSLGIKDALPTLSTDECYEKLAGDGMLVKRPILVHGDTVLVGFDETRWEKLK